MAAIAGAAFIATLATLASAQVHISGRIVSPGGSPIPGSTVTFRSAQGTNEFSEQTDRQGKFAVDVVPRTAYQINLTLAGNPSPLRELETIEATDKQDISLGDIVLDSSPKEPTVRPGRISIQKSNGRATFIAAIYIDPYAGTSIRLVLNNASEVQPPLDKEQVGESSPLISADNQSAGWLTDYKNCCTSYPLSLGLIIYRPGKPLRKFIGDGRAIFDWHFAAGGKQVAFYQDFPHGVPAQHYELRDIETNHLIDKWNGNITPKSPQWVKSFESKSAQD